MMSDADVERLARARQVESYSKNESEASLTVRSWNGSKPRAAPDMDHSLQTHGHCADLGLTTGDY